jgi:hypothetical protein
MPGALSPNGAQWRVRSPANWYVRGVPREPDEPCAEPDTGYYGFPSLRPNRYDARMFKQGEYASGTPVPITGRYELCHVLGRRTGVIADCPLGEVLPAGPRGWFWSLVTVDEPPENGTTRLNYVSDET